jgi:hypothetical protein
VLVNLRWDHGYSEAFGFAANCDAEPLRNCDDCMLDSAEKGEVVDGATYRWLAWLLLLLLLRLHLRRARLRLLQALTSLAGESVVWTAHAAVVIDRMKAAGGR